MTRREGISVVAAIALVVAVGAVVRCIEITRMHAQYQESRP